MASKAHRWVICASSQMIFVANRRSSARPLCFVMLYVLVAEADNWDLARGMGRGFFRQEEHGDTRRDHGQRNLTTAVPRLDESWRRERLAGSAGCIDEEEALLVDRLKIFHAPPPSVGGLDLDSRNSGCARLARRRSRPQFLVRCLTKWLLVQHHLRGEADGPSSTHREAYGLKPRPQIMIRVAGGASHLSWR